MRAALGGRGAHPVAMLWTETHPGSRAAAAAVGAVSLAAWLSLLAWEASPHGRYLDHGSLDDLRLAAPIAVALFVGGWVLMVLAMMLPTAYPVVALFGEVVARRDDRVRLVASCVAGYVAVWAAFGGLAFAGDLVLHRAVERVAWVDDHSWVIGAGVLALAGAYQFTDLKQRCATQCRSPRLVVLRHWTGRDPWLQSFTLGVDHGMSCVGCCWSLMLVLFAAGVGSVPLMLALGTVMAAEKNAPWGSRLSAPLGFVLLALAAVVATVGATG